MTGSPLDEEIREAQAKLEGQPAPKQQEPNRTDFALLRGSATVNQGLVSNDDLVMKSPLLRITGAGEISLPQEAIDYTLTTKFVGSLEGHGVVHRGPAAAHGAVAFET